MSDHKSAPVDEEKLHDFIGQMLGDLGGAFSTALVRIGEQLGLYKALKENGPMTAQELADSTRTAERYIREWAAHQAASNYIAYDAASGKFTLPPEQAMVFAEDDSPVNMLGAFDAVVAIIEGAPKVQEAFHTGEGVSWGDHSACLFCATAKFFRPGYKNHVVQEWLPALDGVTDKLGKGGKVADIGCGYGISTALMARAFPNAKFVGYDFHEDSIAHANDLAKQEGLDNLSFEVALAKNFPAQGYDLVTMFDCLHDMGDPVGAAAHIRSTLADDGTLMVHFTPEAARFALEQLHKADTGQLEGMEPSVDSVEITSTRISATGKSVPLIPIRFHFAAHISSAAIIKRSRGTDNPWEQSRELIVQLWGNCLKHSYRAVEVLFVEHLRRRFDS